MINVFEDFASIKLDHIHLRNLIPKTFYHVHK